MQQRDRDAVAGHRRQVAQRSHRPRRAPPAACDRADEGCRARPRPDGEDLPVVAVDDHRVARLDLRQRSPRRRPTIGMSSARATIATWPSASPPRAPRREPACGRSRAARPARCRGRPGSTSSGSSARGRRALAGQVPQQPVGEVVEVGQALAQIGVGDLAMRARVSSLHALHRRLGGQAGADRLARCGRASRGPAANMR